MKTSYKLICTLLTPHVLTMLVLLATLTSRSHGAPSAPPKLYLGPAQWEVDDFKKETGGTLLVELLRQSVIISAELERHWLTYDATMGEPKPSDAVPLNIVIKYRVFENKHCEFGVVTNGTKFLTGFAEIPKKQYLVYKSMLEQAETLSRNTFPELLENKGSATSRPSKSTAIPETIFSQVNTFSLWNDLRTLHTLLETGGETPELLSALSQGYATLGLVNHSLGSKMPKACYAKALIYAQRLVVARPNDARSYYTRAYAWALPGFHALAIKDLEKVQELGGQAPSWLSTVRSYLDYDIPALKSALCEDDFDAQLAGTFLLMASYRTHNQNFIFEHAWPALEHNPKNLQLAHAGAVVGGLSTKGALTSQYPLIFEYMIMNDLRSMEGMNEILTPFITLPQETVEGGINYPATHERLTRLVEQGTDSRKPSMATLATIIRETRFVQIWHRLQYLRHTLGVPTENALREMMPDIEGHPYAPLLHTYSKTADIKKIFGNQEIIDPPFQIYFLLHGRHITDERAKFTNQPQWRGQMLSMNNGDYMALDLERINSYRSQLIDVNPNSINGIQKEFEYSKESPETLYKRFQPHVDKSALLSMALAQRLEQDGQTKGAAHFYQQSLDLEEYPACLKAFAGLWLKEGDVEKWHQLMERSMELPDQAGLRNSFTRVDIARELLRLGHWEAGLQYTEDAASSYTQTSLELAAWVNGLLGQSDRGLEYAIASMKRYSYSDFFNQYILSFAPTLTDEARALTEDFYLGELNKNAVKQASAANHNFITGDYKTYCEMNEACLKATNDPWYGLVAALVAEDQGWLEKRDKILSETLERFPKLHRPSANRKAMKEFAEIYVEINALGRMEPGHIEQVQSFSRQFPDEGFNYDAHAMAGDLLRLKGHENEAREVYVNGLSPIYAKRMIGFIPFFRLRQMGADPAQLLKERIQKEESQ
ncbi:hypothetical protein P4C99_13810 [Pontiellaceae bacterium B1224]|nr:hypothetical protein [Pontiellaceae bacterium B1224]